MLTALVLVRSPAYKFGMARRAVPGAADIPDGTVSAVHVAAVERFCLRDGRMLCARRWPGGGEDTLVFLHGLLDSSEGWASVCERFPGTRVAVDLPGFGHSDVPHRGSMAGYAEDVAEGLEALGVERFTLVGHSLGGAVATAVAEMIPDRVAALVLLAPAGFGRIHLAEAASIPGIRSVVQAALPFALSNRFAVTTGYMTMVANGRLPERAVVERVTSRSRALVDGAREGTRAVVDAGRSRDAFHRRHVDYNGPVFAVWGDQDRLVPVSHRHGVRAALPHARVEVWPGMGHHPLHERFDDLIALIGNAIIAARAQPALRSLSLAASA